MNARLTTEEIARRFADENEAAALKAMRVVLRKIADGKSTPVERAWLRQARQIATEKEVVDVKDLVTT